MAKKNKLILNGEDQTIDLSFNADVVGTAASETIKIAAGVNAEFINAGAGDRVEVAGNLADYTVTASGNGLTLTDADDNAIVLFVGGASTLAFADGFTTLGYDDENLVVTLDGVTVDDSFDAASVTLETTDPTDPTENPIDVAVTVEGGDVALAATDAADVFNVTLAGDQTGNAINNLTITDFANGDSLNLEAVGLDASALAVLDPSFNNTPYSVSIDGTNMQVVLFDGDSIAELDTWTLTFEAVDEAVIDAVEGAADADAAVTAVAAEWGAGWLLV